MAFNASDLLALANQNIFNRMSMQAISGLGDPNQNGAQNVAGYALSKLASYQPYVSAGLQSVGLDPMSAASGAYGAAKSIGLSTPLSLMSGGIAGIGMKLAGTGANFIAGGLLEGASNQMQLSNNLRSNFNFINSGGSRGFNSFQAQSIADNMRVMTHDLGPQNEHTSMGELSKLATNMGRMGMAQEVNSVRQFNVKFKEMVSTLKHMAEDMGSSLEDAQKMMHSMKGSGIFQKVDQIKMSRGMKINAMAGGLAVSEMTGISNIGSQLVRSIGGLGKQGAFAGMQTLTQVGVAQQLGLISDEDLYNATGQSGAAGRQALATAQMQQSASFLSSGRGRRFLASMAGVNGTLDEGAVEEWMNGGMGIGRTMTTSSANARKIGQANFIRNEGTLRGEVLSKFGGLAQTMAYKSWLSSKNLDPNNMDDRSMLAFQKYSGMGEYESQIALRQVEALPEMFQHIKETEMSESFSKSVQRAKYSTGFEGAKRRVGHFKDKLRGNLDKSGADLLNWMEETVSSYFNEFTNKTEVTATEGLRDIEKGIKLGGKQAMTQYRRFFGGGLGKTLGGGLGHDNSYLLEKHETLNKWQSGAISGVSDRGALSYARKNSEFIKELTISGTGKDSATQLLDFAKALKEKSLSGDSSATKLFTKYFSGEGASTSKQMGLLQTIQNEAGVGASDSILSSLNRDLSSRYLMSGEYRTSAEKHRAIGASFFGKQASELENPDSLTSSRNTTTSQKLIGAAIMGNPMLLMSGGLARFGGHAASWLGEKTGIGALKTAGNVVNNAGNFVQNVAGRVGAIAGSVFSYLGADSEAEKSKAIRSFSTMSTSKLFNEKEGAEAIGKMFESKEDLAMLADLHSDDADLKAQAKSNVLAQIQQLRKNGSDSATLGKLSYLSSAYVGSKFSEEDFKHTDASDKAEKEYRSLMGSSAVDKVHETGDSTLQRLATSGKILKQIKSARKLGILQLGTQQAENLENSLAKLRSEKDVLVDKARYKFGLVKEGEKGLEFTDKGNEMLAGFKDKNAKLAVMQGMGILRHDFGGNDLTGEQIEKLVDLKGKTFDSLSSGEQAESRKLAGHFGYLNKSGEINESMSHMTDEQLKSVSAVPGLPTGSMATNQMNMRRKFKSLKSSTGSEVGAVARMLGSTMGDKDLRELATGRSKGDAINAILNDIGAGDDKILAKSLTEALRDTDTVHSREGGFSIMGMSTGSLTQKKRTEGEKAFSVQQQLQNMDPTTKQKIYEKQEQAAEDRDPKYRIMKENHKEIQTTNKILTEMAKNTLKGPELEKFMNAVKSNAENKNNTAKKP